jgi:hypothetical protein
MNLYSIINGFILINFDELIKRPKSAHLIVNLTNLRGGFTQRDIEFKKGLIMFEPYNNH